MAHPLLRKLAVHYIAPRYPLKPTSLFVSPTLNCNSRCAHCTVWAEGGRKKVELSSGQWREIFHDPFFNAIHTFWFSGGEPTLRPDLSEIATAAIESLQRLESMTIATNALDPDAITAALDKILPMLKQRGIYTHLHISLDGPAEIHDRIRGVPGAFDALRKAVDIARKLQREGFSIGWSFNCVIQRDNVSSLERTLSVAEELGGSITFNLADVAPGFYRSRSGEEMDEANRATISRFIEKLLAGCDPYYRRHYETLKAVIEGGKRPYRCETMEATIYLDPDASIYPCPHGYTAVDIHLSETPPSAAWKRVFNERERIRAALCPTCALGCSFGEGLSFVEFVQLLARSGNIK